jgi:hypothetical protein
VAVGEMHSVCVTKKQLTEDRNVFIWGDNSLGQIPGIKESSCKEPLYLKHFKNIYVSKIVSGKNHIIVFTGEKIYSWGANQEKQLFSNCKAGDILLVQARDLLPQASSIIDVEAYDNSTLALLSTGQLVKSGTFHSLFHVPSTSPIEKICISSKSIHALSKLGVLFSFNFENCAKKNHYKMKMNREKVFGIFSGFHASAVDDERNLWDLDEGKIFAGISCVQGARVNEKFTVVLAGVERVPWPVNNQLMTLFEIAEERVLETLVRIR